MSLPAGSPEATAEVVAWAQAILTALNIGDVRMGSKLHLKLREVMIAYRASIPDIPAESPGGLEHSSTVLISEMTDMQLLKEACPNIELLPHWQEMLKREKGRGYHKGYRPLQAIWGID